MLKWILIALALIAVGYVVLRLGLLIAHTDWR